MPQSNKRPATGFHLSQAALPVRSGCRGSDPAGACASRPSDSVSAVVKRSGGAAERDEPAGCRRSSRLVRGVVVGATAVTLAVLGLELSGSAPRVADSDRVNAAAFTAVLRPGEKLCQPGVALPADAAGIKMLVGTYGRPRPPISVELIDASGRVVNNGSLAGGGSPGYVIVPMRHSGSEAGRLCVTIGGRHMMAVGGSPAPINASSQTLDGRPQGGILALWYMRHGSESWWQLLPTLLHRFGYGKWSFLGAWTFVVGSLLLAAVWIAVLRLMWTEFR